MGWIGSSVLVISTRAGVVTTGWSVVKRCHRMTRRLAIEIKASQPIQRRMRRLTVNNLIAISNSNVEAADLQGRVAANRSAQRLDRNRIGANFESLAVRSLRDCAA